MSVYINKARHSDEATRVRRYSQNRAEWYDGLRKAFLNYCDVLRSSALPHGMTIEQFRAEGLATIEGNRDFWIEAAERGVDDPFAEYQAALNESIDPNMTLEQLQAAMGMGMSQVL